MDMHVTDVADSIRNFEALYPFAIVTVAVVLAGLLASAYKSHKAHRTDQ
jgi:hypothetical protein